MTSIHNIDLFAGMTNINYDFVKKHKETTN